MIVRALQALLVLVILLDILLQALIKTPVWVLFARAKPSPRETVSASIGWAAERGHGWAVFLAALIDEIFGKNHCADAYAAEAPFAEPL